MSETFVTQGEFERLFGLDWRDIPEDYRLVCALPEITSGHIVEASQVSIPATRNLLEAMLGTEYTGRIPKTWKHAGTSYDVLNISGVLARKYWRDPISFIDPVYPGDSGILAETPIIQVDKQEQARVLRQIQTLWFNYLTGITTWPVDEAELENHLNHLHTKADITAVQKTAVWQRAGQLMFWKFGVKPPDNHPSSQDDSGIESYEETDTTVTVRSDFVGNIFAPRKTIRIVSCTVSGNINGEIVVCDHAVVIGDIDSEKTTLIESLVIGQVGYMESFRNVNNTSIVDGRIKKLLVRFLSGPR